MVPLGVQVSVFETERAASAGDLPQTLAGKAENKKRLEKSLLAFRVSWWGFFGPLRREKLPGADRKFLPAA